MRKPKVDKRGENFYGNYDRNADGTWKRGLDSSLVSWNSRPPNEDTTGYVEGSYKPFFDSEIGYLSCYAVGNQTKHKDKWMVDSGCTDHLSPFPEDFISRKNHTRNCKTANGNIMPIFGPGTVILRHHNGNTIELSCLPEFTTHPTYYIASSRSRP